MNITTNRFFWLMMLLCVASILVPDMSFAQSSQPPVVPHGTCTTDPQFEIPTPAAGGGLISTIVTQIRLVLDQVSQALFQTITGDFGFRYALTATATLYIMFYAVMFTFGMVQITLHDFSLRMIKVGIIALLMSPDAWNAFSVTVVQFFNAGTDEFINSIMAVALNTTVAPGAAPFAVVDDALSKAVSAKMAVTLMAAFFTPPYGPIFGFLIALGLGTFVRTVMTAAWVYLMSLILKSLLFGLAPIFLSFILFARTRYLFEGWLNQIVNATLQPILLFTFFAFFVKLIEASIDNIFINPVCWTEWGDSLRGSPFSVHYWRFALCDSPGGSCEPFGGKWNWNGAQTSGGGPIFPIDIIGVLVLVMLADLATRFNSIVMMIASDLASASTNLAGMQGALSDWFRGAGGGKGPSGGGGLPKLPNQALQQAQQAAAGAVGNRPTNVGGVGGAAGGNRGTTPGL